MAAAVVGGTSEFVPAQLGGQARQIRQRIGGDAGTGAVRAQLFQRGSHRLEFGDIEGFRPAAQDDRVEHQGFDVLGVAFGVLERDLRAVGGAV